MSGSESCERQTHWSYLSYLPTISDWSTAASVHSNHVFRASPLTAADPRYVQCMYTYCGQCWVSYFLKVTCYSYCYILKVTSYFTSYFIDTLLHHLNPNLTIALTLNPSTNLNSNLLNWLNYPPLGDWWNFQWYSTKIHLPLPTYPAHNYSKITLLYNFNAAAHFGKCKLK